MLNNKDFGNYEMYSILFFQKIHLISAINTDKSLKVICSLMFKQLFSRDVLMSMTAQKKSAVKLLFKETNFFACLKGNYSFFIHLLYSKKYKIV